MEWHISVHKVSDEDRRWSVVEQEAVEASDGPSNRVRMCVSMMSVCRVERPVMLFMTSGSMFSD